MSRHRNVRSMNYSEEYDGYDDVYGHSVEDDYCISPGVEQFMYDRSKQPQMSAFFSERDEIAEEDEVSGSNSSQEQLARRDSGKFQWPALSQLDEARLKSCLEEIHNVIGDSVPEHVLVETVLKHNFDISKSLDEVLDNATAEKAPEGAPKPQREKKERNRDRGKKQKEMAGGDDAEQKPADTTNGEVASPADAPLSEPNISALSIKVVPAAAKTKNVTKGFDVSAERSDSETKEALKPEDYEPSPRSQSPLSDRMSPSSVDELDGADGDSAEKRAIKKKTDEIGGGGETVTRDVGKTPSKAREGRDAMTEYLRERGKSKDLLHLVVIGHVDAGKSTLMGHLLYALGQVNKKTMHKYEQESKKLGKQSFVFAWVLDETGEERSRGITMDVGQSKFETKSKVVTLLDAPGHKDFIPNMITGATQADVAMLVVDATRGEFETGFESGGQTREHALLVRSLGVSQLAVVVNKLDTVAWSQDRFREIVKKLGSFLRQAGFRESEVVYVPCSGLTGENLVLPPQEDVLKQWYQGPCLIDVIDQFKSPERSITKPFRLSVGDIFKGTGSGFCVSGRVETGMVQVGDKVLVQPQNETAQVKAISVNDISTHIAFAGDHIVGTLSGIDMQLVSTGSIICEPSQPVQVTSRIQARIVVFDIKVPITKGFPVILHYQCLSEQAIIIKLIAQLHKSTGEVVKRHPRCLTRNSSAVVQIETSRPICMELYRDIKELGRFMLRVSGVTIAAGLVTEIF